MKLVLSPAKSLNFESELPTNINTEACFLGEAERLNKLLKKKSARSLSKLMKISDALGQLNYERNQEWSLPFTPDNARQAVYAFSGDVYRGLDVYNLSDDKLDKLQDTVRIISGLYGLLKPMDLIQPYRLEMGTKFPVGKNKNLYEFWKAKVTSALNDELAEDEVFLNLASNEYFKAIDTKALKVPVVSANFKDLKNGEYKTIMTFAKLARGYMTRYILDTNANTLDDIKGFNYEGYGFSEALSTETELVFIR
ncbi:peroxide stress protein YaaA [Winogradskyella sp. 3972H.M.0a.05]|uniref:peroxide stress protein YaaA n=1 Tax=Winogradskyella sp. 3972H.M.0a.05 TaxID=2950277 RepID=UPI0033977B18